MLASMNCNYGLYVVYGLVQINMKTVDKSSGTPCGLNVLEMKFFDIEFHLFFLQAVFAYGT
jgi:hypothetical protein